MEFSTKELLRKRVWSARPRKDNPDGVKKVGRIRAFVFHPIQLRCVGFLVKRPDAALMFRRPEIFIALNGFLFIDNEIVLTNEPQTKDQSACKALGIHLDACIIWDGLPVVAEDGAVLGIVENVTFDGETGLITQVEIGQGITANVLLGRSVLAPEDIVGFRFLANMPNVPDVLAGTGNEAEPVAPGAIVARVAAQDVSVQGGLAEKAGAATAVVVDKAQQATQAAGKVAGKAAGKAAEAAGKAAEQGAFVTGRQIARAQGMFRAFSDEFKKSLNDE